MKRYPEYLPREYWNLFDDIPKREWADIAYMLATLISGTDEPAEAIKAIIQERKAQKGA